MRALLLMAIAACVACADDVTMSVLPCADDAAPRSAYLRREDATVRVRVSNPLPEPIEGTGTLGLMQEGRALESHPFPIAVPAGASGDTAIRLSLSGWKAGEYRLEARCSIAGRQCRAEAPFWICPEPDRDGLVLAIWRESTDRGTDFDELLRELRGLGMTAVQAMYVSSELLDACLRHRMSCLSISHGNAAAEGYQAPPDAVPRLNASGEPFVYPGATRPAGGSIANLDWQEADAANLGKQVAKLAAHPAYDPRICTSDDFFSFTGLDYNPWNVRRFRELCGMDSPRPEEALRNDFPLAVNREKGVIPDDDPWVLWLRFCSRDVLGRLNRQLTDAVLKATDGRGGIGPICGGGRGAMGLVPYVDMASGQWPPYNFGACGFNMLCSYNYNFYWYPALAQLWWQELGRMGNRNLQQWLMPETMDQRVTTHLQNWYLYMAAGVDGLAYFIYERTTPGALEALGRLGPTARRYRKLLGALEPVPRTVGLLMPFENCCFQSEYPVGALYAFSNLAMAHAEAEPVWPEELPQRRAQYGAILLCDVDWLTESNLQVLRDCIATGCAVLSDSLTEVEVPGSERLDFPLGLPDRRLGYGDLAQVARVKAALERHVLPWARSDDPHLLLRRFRLGGVDYLWVVHLMSRQEDLDHVPAPGEERKATLLPAYAGFDKREYRATVTVPAGKYAVYDTLNGERIECTRQGDRLVIPVRMGTWQGCLIALYPSAPTGLEVRAHAQARQGRPAELEVTVLSGRKALPAHLPLEIAVFEPDGAPSEEYSHTALAVSGRYRFRVPFAANDTPGRWRVQVRELSAALEQSVEIRLNARR